MHSFMHTGTCKDVNVAQCSIIQEQLLAFNKVAQSRSYPAGPGSDFLTRKRVPKRYHKTLFFLGSLLLDFQSSLLSRLRFETQ